MKKIIFYTTENWTGLFARVSLGLLLLPHGLQKVFGWFGGYGFTGTMNYFTGSIGIPWLLGAFIIFTEFIGAILLITGAATRVWSLVIIGIMLGTIIKEHGQYGFFMDWANQLNGEGFEYHLAIIALSILLFMNGAGKYSVDRKLAIQ